MSKRHNRKRSNAGQPNPPAASPRSSAANPIKMSAGRKWLFRLMAIFVVPLLLLGGMEAALRLLDYGYSSSLFKPLKIGGEQFLVENDKFSLRFFSTGL